MLETEGSNRSSQDLHHLSGQPLDLAAVKKPLFSRNKKGRKKSGAQSPSLAQHTIEEGSDSHHNSVLRKSKKVNDRPESSLGHLRHRISSPFDFQHVTHTDREQFTSLGHASGNDTVAGFSGVPSSQAPRRDFHGIKADDVMFNNNLSSDNLFSPSSRSTSALGTTWLPGLDAEDHQAGDHSIEPSRQSMGRTVRGTRSVESFSRPGIHPRAHWNTQGSLGDTEDLDGDANAIRRVPVRSRANRNSGLWDRYAPFSSPPLETTLETITDESDYFGHAVTTPDDTAVPMTPTYSPSLEDVAEEPDRFIDPRPAPSPPTRMPRSPRSPLYESLAAYAQDQPSAQTSFYPTYDSHTQYVPKPRPVSQLSDTLGSATIPRRFSARRTSTTRRQSNTWRAMDDSWEDDVDFIYEHALEAECDLDWEHSSAADNGGGASGRTTAQETQRPNTAPSLHSPSQSVASEEMSPYRGGFYRGNFRPSLLVPSTSSIPELESRSAVSASTADTGVQTPLEILTSTASRPNVFTEGEGFVLTPSLLIPTEYKLDARDDLYNDLLADYEGSDRHVPIFDSSRSGVSSTRSSHVRSSKRSSYDSSLMSSGQLSGIWSSPVRRSASSSGSLPELVPSRRSLKEHKPTVDRLSEQMASMMGGHAAVAGEEDDDLTPPGRALPNRTFFAAGGADNDNKAPATVQADVKLSSELARHGSSRGAPATGHSSRVTRESRKLKQQ
ncbi:hypothetical protein M011DRAFT_474582 [Sporormia fimetaria CBS 119925]|uniref:CRIB domain-containing protein n=1 Tax=Sporormia fimetaria CBS 119925 TaxID=1340428 RepID=A0A6A6VIX2_9PLEO|nr:hypothetical protein M011DRAFT_474582 [Sporormia fimetaria CBS 119925]